MIFTIAGILVALLISASLIYFVMVPRFHSWSSAREKIKEDEARLEVLDRNLQTLKNLDSAEISEDNEALDKLLPTESDNLRITSLVEAVAAASGMKVSALQIQTPSQVGNSSVSGVSQTTPQSASTTGQSSAPKMRISFSGSYQSLLGLLINLNKMDRVASVTDLNISKNQSESAITATVGIEFPLYSLPAVASAGTFVGLTEAEKKDIDDLLSQIMVTTFPASEPLGRVDPFN